MGKVEKELRKIRIHHEGTNTLLYGGVGLVLTALVLWLTVPTKIPFQIFTVVFGTVYGIVLSFYQCPIHYFGSEDTGGIIVAPADGHIVVIEEVNESEYFHGHRSTISIFMSLWNVYANWFPVDGVVKSVQYFDGSFHKAWLSKASEENEHADTIITTLGGTDILCHRIVGVMARRIMIYVRLGEDYYVGEYFGFIKLGSRVDIFFPVGSEVYVKMGQAAVGDQTVIAKLKPSNK